MTDASHRPVDGAEPRSAPEPAADPMTAGPDDAPGSEQGAAIPEPSDGEALPPIDQRDEGDAPSLEPTDGASDGPAEAAETSAVAADGGDVSSGAGIGGPDDDGETGDVVPSVEAQPGPVPVPADQGAAESIAVVVEGGAGIGDLDQEVAVEPVQEASAAVGEPAPPALAEAVPEAPAAEVESTPAVAEAVPEAPAAEVESTPAVAETGPEAPVAGAEAPPAGAAAKAGAAQGAPAPTLPPPPPELAEVPTDAGRIVSGRVRELAGDDVIVDLDDGRVGVINKRNLGAEGEPGAVLAVGDPVEGAVLARSDPQHRVVLSRTWALKKRAWEAVAAAAAENTVLTGVVVSVGQKGVVVDVGVRGFVPASHLELGPVADLQAYAGQQLQLRVLDVDVGRERLVLSRRSLLLKEQRRSLHDVLSALQPGEVRRGRVASLSDYGAFVDLGGVNGLVHLSELSWHRVRHPSEVVAVGDEVDVKVLDVKVKKRRVSLSMRQLSDDPLGTLVPGEIRSGPVTRLVDFGAFVDLSGVEGLVHLSELAEYRVSAPEEIVAPGEEVRVKVLSVDRKRRRVELSIRQAAEYGG